MSSKKDWPVYDRLKDGLLRMTPNQHRRFRLRVLRNNAGYNTMPLLSACLCLWQEAETDARRPFVAKVQRITCEETRDQYEGMTEKEKQQTAHFRRIGALLHDAEKAGSEAAEAERQRQIKIMEEVLDDV